MAPGNAREWLLSLTIEYQECAMVIDRLKLWLIVMVCSLGFWAPESGMQDQY